MCDILIIDDDQLLGKTVVSLLETEGFSAVAIDDPRLIAKTITKEQPKVIVLDYFLPGANGAVIAEALKKDTLTKDIPIVMISSSYGIEPVLRSAGVDVFLPKPFDIGKLVSIIKRVSV